MTATVGRHVRIHNHGPETECSERTLNNGRIRGACLDVGDHCHSCGNSEPYCDGYQHISGERCCNACSHALPA